VADLVLIVDDYEINRDALGIILEDDYDIIYAENGKEALEKPHMENVTHLAVEMSHEMEETIHFHSHQEQHHLHKHIHSETEMDDAARQAVEMAWEMEHPRHLDDPDHAHHP